MKPYAGAPQRTPAGCCSEQAIAGVDAAIAWAIQRTKADASQVHLVGVSGGGYVALCQLLRGAQPLRSVQAWAPITDLARWHAQTSARGLPYARDIEACSGSAGALDAEEARRRSPLHMQVPAERVVATRVHLYAGIRDGHQGSVPISHSLLFYDRLLPADSPGFARVTAREMLALLDDPAALAGPDVVGDRGVILERDHAGVSLVIFEGGHETLPGAALQAVERGGAMAGPPRG